ARTVGLGLPVEQLGVNAVARDQSVKTIATATTALVALDVQHLELTDQAKNDRTFTGHITSIPQPAAPAPSAQLLLLNRLLPSSQQPSTAAQPHSPSRPKCLSGSKLQNDTDPHRCR